MSRGWLRYVARKGFREGLGWTREGAEFLRKGLRTTSAASTVSSRVATAPICRQYLCLRDPCQPSKRRANHADRLPTALLSSGKSMSWTSESSSDLSCLICLNSSIIVVVVL